MDHEKFEDKYIPKFKSEEQLQACVLTKAVADLSTCTYCDCSGIACSFCMLNDRDCCIAYLKQHHKHLENYLKDIIKTPKGEETMENDFPKLKPGMAITFTDYDKLGFMVSETQIMYIHPHNSYSAIVEDWDSLGDREDIDVPYSRIKAVYASTDIRNEAGEPIGSFIPLRLARMAEVISKGEDPATLPGVKVIWRRQEHKEMTVEEIEKELGYKIKIVGEDR